MGAEIISEARRKPTQVMAPSAPGGQKLLVIGGGGHARVVTEAARAQGWRVLGFFDDDSSAAIDTETPRLGDVAKAGGVEPDGFALDGTPSCAIVAMGSLELRARLISELRGMFGSVIHPSAVISPSAQIGSGVFISASAVVQSRAKIDDHAIINTGAIIEHDCAIHTNAHIAPGAVLGGAVTVGRDTLVGLGARVKPGVRIGAGCTIGAGAVVVRNVADHATVIGVPAKPAEWWGSADNA
jgi:UDP-perosamine 4-acetyltransferase